MKVLIAGGGTLCELLIARLNRERHDVYQILRPQTKYNEDISSSERNATVYYFELNDESIGFVIQSVQPEAVIFMGVMNEEYDWTLNNRSASAMLSGLTNMLCLSAENQVPRFVYLSSAEVYGTNQNCVLDEYSEKKPDNLKGYFVSEGENICAGFNTVSGLNPTVLRLSSVYGTTSEHSNDFLSRLLFTVHNPDDKSRSYLPPVNMQFNPTYLSDAVDAIFKSITAENQTGGIYNVAGPGVFMMDVYDAVELAAGLKVEKPEPEEPIILTVDASLFAEKYNYRPLVDIAAGVKRTFKTFNKERKKEEKQKRKSGDFRKLLKFITPFIENVFVFLMMLGLQLLSSRVPQLENIDFIMIYIVVVSIVFGLLQSSIAIVIAFGFMIWESIGQRMTTLDFVTGIDILLRMFQLLVIGMMCGYSTDNKKNLLDEKDLALADVRTELDTIFEINDRNTRIKQALDSRLSNYETSLAKIYSITDSLNSLQVDKVFYSAINVVAEIMKSSDVCIYIISNYENNMCRLVARSPQSERQLKKSILLSEFGELAEYMLRDGIYVNRALNPELPVMAAPIFSGRNLVSIIMLWALDFEDLTLHNVNNFLVLSKLISTNIEKAYEYMQSTTDANKMEGLEVLTASAFNELLQIHDQAEKDGISQYCVVNISLENSTLEETAAKLSKLLRNTDYIGFTEGGRVQVLLTNTNQNDLAFVRDRMGKAGITIEEPQ